MNGALSDITVLDLTQVLSGPYAGMWLGDLGANVIKIEKPGKGDDARLSPPHVNDISTFFAAVNRNKRSITLNLKDPEGRALFLEMVKKADVVLSNFRPGVMERLGLGYEDLSAVNERIIWAAISGFGQKGPYAERPAYDAVAQAMGGIMALTGEEGSDPTRVGASVADITAGMNAVIGILAALHARTLTGRGQFVDVAMVDSVVALSPSENNRYFIYGVPNKRLGNRYIGNSPYGAFKAKDGNFILGCGSDKQFARFCTEVLGRPELLEDDRFCVMAHRSDNHELVKELVEDWAGQHTVSEVVDILLSKGIPGGPVYDTADVAHDEHIVGERKMFVEIDQPGLGAFHVTNNPVKLSGTETSIRRPAPMLGQHNEEIYRDWLGLSEERIRELKQQGVI